MENIEQIHPPTQEDVRADLRNLFLGSIRLTLECLLEDEMRAMVGARKWQRIGARKDFRNGTYLRRMLTSMGQIEINVPRAREGGSASGILGRYARRTEEVDEAIVSAYVNGVSTRKVGKVTKALAGKGVGRSTVSRVTKQLDAAVEGLKTTAITEPITYLYLDGTFLDARWARRVENVAALVAYGIGPDGHRQLLGITIGAQESEASWTELLDQLVKRGLRGVRLVVADEHAGLAAAVRHVLPEAERQRCVVHLERNVIAKAPRRLQGRLAREVSAIFRMPSLKQAKQALETLKTGLGQQVSEAMDCLDAGFHTATRFYAFPEAHWKRIRSTNGLERLHGEIKRRIRAVGAFPDRASALRLVTAVALEASAIWTDRRYLDMSLLNEEEIEQAA